MSEDTPLRITAAGTICFDAAAGPIEKMPAHGHMAQAGDYRIGLGGPAAAGISVISALGAQASFVGPMGMAPGTPGSIILHMLSERGVDTSGVTQLEDASGSGSIIAFDQSGERTIVHAPNANNLLTADTIKYDSLRGEDGFLLAGVGILKGLTGEGLEIMLRQVKEMGLLTAVDTADTGKGPSEAISLLQAPAQHIDFLHVSEKELLQFSGIDDHETGAGFFLDNGVTRVVITLGEKGSYYADNTGKTILFPAHSIEAIDTTGCGDIFTATFFWKVLQGALAEEALTYATAASALVAQIGQGASSIASLAQLEEFIEAVQ